VPWIEYKAEDGSTNGVILEASREFGEIAAESAGRRSVKLNAATFENIKIDNAGTYGILISLSTTGSPSFNGVVVTNAKSGGLRNNAPGNRFKITRGADNDGW
jgi:hypothetical protein